MLAFLTNKQKIFNEQIEAKITKLEDQTFDETFKIKARILEISKKIEKIEKSLQKPIENINYNELFKEIKKIKTHTKI